MSQKDYRELQISSSQLVLVFTAILGLGVIIFLLGVSVGKKQAEIVKETQASSLVPEETAAEPLRPKPSEAIQKELASHEKADEEKASKPEAIKTTPPSKPEVQKTQSIPERKNLYWVQVGAFSNKSSALRVAETYRSKGYRSVVLEPFPTDRRNIYRVRLGSFPSREAAEKARDALAQEENKKKTDYLVVRY
ncbi:MAG: SPOR domain-containing protein [Candidatus Aminicenantales bacterium]